MFGKIDQTMHSLEIFLESDFPMAIDEFRNYVGQFSRELKSLLTEYFEYPSKQIEMGPYINFYRQVQHYFVFLMRYSAILEIPHHSEILQTLDIIHKKEQLIDTVYTDMAQRNRDLLKGPFSQRLEKQYGKKFNSKDTQP